jgi:hypothetical protein
MIRNKTSRLSKSKTAYTRNCVFFFFKKRSAFCGEQVGQAGGEGYLDGETVREEVEEPREAYRGEVDCELCEVRGEL